MKDELFPEDRRELLKRVIHFPEIMRHRNFPIEIMQGGTPELEEVFSDIWERDPKPRLEKAISNYFDLSKYADTALLAPDQWALQLWLRRHAREQLKVGRELDEESDFGRTAKEYYSYSYQILIYQILIKPIAEFSDYKGLFWKIKNDEQCRRISTRNLDRSDVYYLVADILAHSSVDTFEGLRQKVEELDDDSREFSRLPIDSKDEILRRFTPSFHLEIDLNYSDDQLVDDFKSHVAYMRKLTGVQPFQKKQFNDAYFKSLAEHRVLEYLDLQLLDTYLTGGKTLRNHNVANIIFPPDNSSSRDIDVVEKLRKTTITHAKRMTSEKGLQALFAQVLCNSAFL